MNTLSEATTTDYEVILKKVQSLPGYPTVEETAQAFIGEIYDHFTDSLVLLRIFASVPYGSLQCETRRFVEKRAADTGNSHLLGDRTPVLALLGTRGRQPDWNERRKSQRFRCIPLLSTAFVASLSMLSMQFARMNFDLSLIDSWEEKIAAAGRADGFRGMLYARDAATDKDERGRMIVPMQDFVAEHQVRTALGFGTGYENHPTLLTMFAFTSETIEQERVEPLSGLLDAFRDISGNLVREGRFFSAEL